MPVELEGLDDVELLGRGGVLEVMQRRHAVARVRYLAELDRRSVTETVEGLTTANWWARATGCSRVEAGRQIRYSVLLVERFGELLAALEAGRMSWDQVVVVLAKVNDRTIDGFESVQDHLVEMANGSTFRCFARGVARLARRIDADGGHRPGPDDSHVSLPEGLDGARHLAGTLYGGRGELVAAALERRTDELALDQHRCLEADPTIPRRTRRQLRAQALEDLVLGSTRVEVGVVVPAEGQLGAATDDGRPLDDDFVGDLHDIAASWRSVITDTGGVPLSMGRATRHATTAQRMALSLRDGGCVFPGCEAPPHHCDAHHVTPWDDGGPTDLDNLAHCCRRHHRLFHSDGWRLDLDDTQRPVVTTPDGRHLPGQRHGTRIEPQRE